MVVIKHARSYRDALKKITRATKAAEKKFMKEGYNINKNSKAAKQIRKEATEYWKNHIYIVFNERRSSGLKTTGQLGNSLVIQFRSNEIRWYMKRIGHPSGITGGGECYDYGRLLRQNSTNAPQRSSPWRYSWAHDYKVRNPDGQNSINYKKYWGTWEKQWEKKFFEIVDKYILDHYMDIVYKELVKNL